MIPVITMIRTHSSDSSTVGLWVVVVPLQCMLEQSPSSKTSYGNSFHERFVCVVLISWIQTYCTPEMMFFIRIYFREYYKRQISQILWKSSEIQIHSLSLGGLYFIPEEQRKNRHYLWMRAVFVTLWIFSLF